MAFDDIPIPSGIPLRHTDDSAVRVGNTRIPLETVVIDFNKGASAEEIVNHFPTLRRSNWPMSIW